MKTPSPSKAKSTKKPNERFAIDVVMITHMLSVNMAWAGRRFKTPQYQAFEEEMLYSLPKKQKVYGEVEMHYEFRVKNMRRDVSNMIKPLEDILVKKGYIEDDRFVTYLTAKKIKSDVEGFTVQILPLRPR